jgi:hypothetical protein
VDGRLLACTLATKLLSALYHSGTAFPMRNLKRATIPATKLKAAEEVVYVDAEKVMDLVTPKGGWDSSNVKLRTVLRTHIMHVSFIRPLRAFVRSEFS